MFIRFCRSTFALVAGLLVISVLVESVEFALVAVANGRMTTDSEGYFTIRNQAWFLTAKLVYNTIGAVARGYLAARAAGCAYLHHGIALAAIQSSAFIWALTKPQIRHSTPMWMWTVLIPLSAAGIIIGASCCRKHRETRFSDVCPDRSEQMARQ